MLDFNEIYKLTSNSNMIISGVAGSGKTVLSKLIVHSDVKNGVRTLVIDDEKEFKSIADVLEGTYIDWSKESNDSTLNNNLIVVTPISPYDVNIESREDLIRNNLIKILEIASNNNIAKLHMPESYIRFLFKYFDDFFPLLNNLKIISVTNYLSELNSSLVNSLFDYIISFKLDKSDSYKMDLFYKISVEMLISLHRHLKRGHCILYNLKNESTQEAYIELNKSNQWACL